MAATTKGTTGVAKTPSLTREDAEHLARVLRALCILKPGHTLHVGGHVVAPTKRGVTP